MSFYYTCSNCGATLDPGEKCDCEKEKGSPETNQTDPRTDIKSAPVNSITQKSKICKSNPLRDLRVSKNIPAKEMVGTVRALYPKYDKMLQSKCEHGEEYGIDIKPRAMDALLEKYAPELLAEEKHRRDGRHRLKCRVECRLEDNEYAALVLQIKKDGFDTMQAWLAFMIRRYLKSKPTN